MISYLATALLAAAAAAAPAQPIQWQSDYGKALAATRANDLPLLVVLDKPAVNDARLDPALLGQDTEAGSLQQDLHDFELCHVDVTTEYGQKVADVFHAKKFPYTAVIDKSGRYVLFSNAGEINADQWNNIVNTFKASASSTALTHVSYKMSGDSITIEKPSTSFSSGSYCPSCQRKGY